jgi:hypothetical protein
MGATAPIRLERPISQQFDAEKNGADPNTTEISGNKTNEDAGSDSDVSEKYQNGVQRVRAITSIWSKYTLASMFAL